MPNNKKSPTNPRSSRKNRDDSRSSAHQYTSLSSSSSKKDEKSTPLDLVSLAHVDRRDQATSNSLLGRLKSLREDHRLSSSTNAPQAVSLAHVDRRKSTTSSSSSSRPAPPPGSLFGASLAHLDCQDKHTTHASSSSSTKPNPVNVDSQESRLARFRDHRRAYSSSPRPIPSSRQGESNLSELLAKHYQASKEYTSSSKLKSPETSTFLNRFDRHDNGISNLLKSIPISSTRPPASMVLQTKSYFTTEYDLQMAFQQTNYDSRTPEKQTKQDEWAQSKMAGIALCPGGWGWQRIEGGYHCSAEMHYIPDWLLAEEKGGLMITNVVENKLEGPFYGDNGNDSAFARYWVDQEGRRREDTPLWEQQAFLDRFEGYESARRREKREKGRKGGKMMRCRVANHSD